MLYDPSWHSQSCDKHQQLIACSLSQKQSQIPKLLITAITVTILLEAAVKTSLYHPQSVAIKRAAIALPHSYRWAPGKWCHHYWFSSSAAASLTQPAQEVAQHHWRHRHHHKSRDHSPQGAPFTTFILTPPKREARRIQIYKYTNLSPTCYWLLPAGSSWQEKAQILGLSCWPAGWRPGMWCGY